MLLRNLKSILFKVLCCFFVLYPNGANLVPGEKINYNLVHSWADKLGMELFHLGDFITRRKEVQESFKQAQVVSRAGAKIVDNMANEIKTMMDSKISAVRRIMDTAENTALTYQSEKPDKNFSYYNAKEMIEPHEPIPTAPPRDLEDAGGPKIFVQPKEIVLTPKAEFFNTPINMSVSSVHVPTNVYDRASDTIKAIEWSENLDQIFRDNYKKDPTLSWQFFGSSTGFMRQFPASKWKADPVDLYDCRLRSWFMEAATSPKDVIILLDGSGSMTGQRLDIAKHVVNTILDTLGTNDFVNIFTFSDKVKPVVGCFEDTLVQDMEMSDYLWQLEQNADQKENILEYRKVSFRMLDPDEVRRREYRRMKKAWDQPTESDDYHFMTTISMPVYDRRENATKIANLLGVAGTDVPIRDIKKLLSPFLLGVNGYAFIVTNNGYILFHPDFRPIFQRYILKPAYNSVDMIEVELLDDDRPPRDFNPVLLTIRDSIINQSTGSKWMLVKNHFDEMKRVARVKRQYYWTAIQNTPFTLVITYPELYGVYRLQIRTEDEIHRMNIKGSNTLSYFTGKRWKIHPKWLFCKHSNMTFETPEEELLWFLGKMSQPGWKWPSSRSALPPEHTAAMYCDRQLMQSLVFDARVTEWFSKNTSFNSKDDKGNEFKQRFGITVAFLATHSGLTRWQEFHSNMAEELGAGESFSEHNNKAINEIWYKRAVDQHFVREESFVYSVPFDAGETAAETLVTASHAVFHTEGGKSAPAAVVGFQFQHSALLKLFRNITGNACAVDDKDCYVLDNNGFIIISPSRHETGRFFGEINGAIMHRLVEENVYKRVTVYDYQAVCFVPDGENNSSSNVLTPLFHVLRAFKWILTTIVLYLVELSAVAADFFEHYVDENMTDYMVNVKNNEWVRLVTLQRTRLKPCDMQRDLYTLFNEKDNVVYNMTAHGCERPFVVLPIPASNLILLVIDQMCPRDATHILTVNPMDINYPLEENQTLACFKRDHEFTRVRPISCISRHVNESNIELCGNASSVLINTFLFLITIGLNRLL
ncbi:voltage-dependent calcium channel subunit alpha-2/delta-3 isoform X2 [Calliphora vicina]|uniref:voltage-dependent calcium channel subunit alpha-2/delta-3 isoform X2 n=1 Tax=Calliphora vicina TaxID=7373 RepID=UPI00325B0222